ncbi:hypothetical protein BDW75DRAFT_202991 [Aspergillus navahoensis]
MNSVPFQSLRGRRLRENCVWPSARDIFGLCSRRMKMQSVRNPVQGIRYPGALHEEIYLGRARILNTHYLRFSRVRWAANNIPFFLSLSPLPFVLGLLVFWKDSFIFIFSR